MAVKGNEPLLYTANPFLLSPSFLLSILPVQFEKLKVRVTVSIWVPSTIQIGKEGLRKGKERKKNKAKQRNL